MVGTSDELHSPPSLNTHTGSSPGDGQEWWDSARPAVASTLALAVGSQPTRPRSEVMDLLQPGTRIVVCSAWGGSSAVRSGMMRSSTASPSTAHAWRASGSPVTKVPAVSRQGVPPTVGARVQPSMWSSPGASFPHVPQHPCSLARAPTQTPHSISAAGCPLQQCWPPSSSSPLRFCPDDC